MACTSAACCWLSGACSKPPFSPTAEPTGAEQPGSSWTTSTLTETTVSVPLVFKGGFDYFINRGNCQNGAASFSASACLQLTNASAAVTTSNNAQVPGRLKVNGLYFAGGAVDIDCL